MFFCKNIIPWELPRSVVQEYESTGLTNMGHNARSDWFGPAARDPLKNHIAACSPPPYHFCASVHYAWLSTQRLAGVVNPLRKQISQSRDTQSKATPRPFAGSLRGSFATQDKSGPPYGGIQRGGAPEKANLPQMGSIEFRPKAGPSLVRRADSLGMTTFLGSSESVTLRMKRERNGGNGKFLPPHSN